MWLEMDDMSFPAQGVKNQGPACSLSPDVCIDMRSSSKRLQNARTLDPYVKKVFSYPKYNILRIITYVKIK